MKTTLAVIALTSFLSNGMLKAEEITLPVINKPAILEEGTQRNLTQSQIAELLPWAKNSKIFLNDLLDNTQGLSAGDQIERLVEGVSSAVNESAPKNSELLMRYALNRSIVLIGILDKEMDASAVGSADVKLRVLKASIRMALKYYETDMAMLTKKSVAPYVVFGLDYFEFLNELNKSIFDASAQYSIQRTSLEWLQWDLYRDLNNAIYAPQIVKINNGLKTFPVRKLTDAQSIAYIRQMKALSAQLKTQETLKKLELEKQMAMAASEAERIAILNRMSEEQKLRLEEEERQERLRKGLPAVDNTIRGGDAVITANSVRIVEYVSDDGRAVLKANSDYYSSTVAISSIQKAVPDYKGYYVGANVLDGNSVRTVTHVGHKGALALASNSDYYAKISSVSSSTLVVSSYGGLKAGDKVIYNNVVRTVEYVDNTGRVVLASNSNYYRTFATSSTVSRVQ